MFSSLSDLYKIFTEHPRIVTDSRIIIPSCIFFALKGDRFNGNHFAAAALEQGAAYVIIDEPEYQTDARCLLVENVLLTLQDLARHHRCTLTIPVIGITGTNGKTTTKELISAVLSRKYKVVNTTGNLNNHIGVPLTLLRMDRETGIAVIEMGANHPGEIDFLCRIALPGYGIITNVGKAHLEGFGSFEGVVRTKTELYRFLSETGGKVFINSADSILMEHSLETGHITYGFDEKDFLRGSLAESGDFVRLNLTMKDGGILGIQSRLFGGYNAPNILASACIGRYFDVSDEDIRLAIESYTPANNRSQVRQTDRNTLVLDAYNANPSSMEAALRFFACSTYENKVVILGDMLELGGESDTLHTHILQILGELQFPEVYLVGPVFTRVNTKRENICFTDSDLAKLWFSHHSISSKTILLKGSRGMKLETIAEIL